MEEKLYICESDNLSYYLNLLKENGYQYIVKAKDNFLSGWGNSGRGGHVQLIACKNSMERETILRDLYNDKTMLYVNWYLISDKKGIYSSIRNKSYTIRNDWTRCF